MIGVTALTGAALLLGPLNGRAATAYPKPVRCPNVRGGALSTAVVRGISCTTAQQIWNHFAPPTGLRLRFPPVGTASTS